MTLQETINKLLEIGSKQHNINYVGEGDIYTLNSIPNINYSVFFITQQQHQQSENTITYNLYLYYIDRLTNKEENRTQIQSNGIVMLGNIVNTFINEVDDAQLNYSITYQPFTHKFADMCAGVYGIVSITLDNGLGVCNY